MITVSEIKTPNCSRCKAIEPQYKELKEKLLTDYPNKIEFHEYVLNINEEAKTYMIKYNLRAAPSFIVETDLENGKVVKFEELKETLSTVLQ